MKRISILLLLTIGLVFAYDKPDNFKGIKFGTDRRIVIKKLTDLSIISYATQVRPGDYETKYGYGANELHDIKELSYIEFSNYKLGDEKFELTLYFWNDQFYYFIFKAYSHSYTYFESVLKDADYLKDIFIKKYGNYARKYDVNTYDVNEGLFTYRYKWIFTYQTVYIGISEKDFRCYAVAVVYDDKIEKEEEEYKKQQEKKSINNAVDDF